MKPDRTLLLLSVLTLLGMIGLYVILFRAYQLYEEQRATFAERGAIGGVLSLFGSS